MACMPVAACAAGFLWQAVAANPRKTRQTIPKVRFKVFFLTRSFSLRQATAWNSGFPEGFFGRRANRRGQLLLPRAGTIEPRRLPAENDAAASLVL
jgi:hypothetical protein